MTTFSEMILYFVGCLPLVFAIISFSLAIRSLYRAILIKIESKDKSILLESVEEK
jgi:hypothetical protein